MEQPDPESSDAKLSALISGDFDSDVVVGLFLDDVHEALNAVLDASGINRAELARRLDVTRPVITKALRPRTNLTITSVARMFQAMGYRVQLEVRPDELSLDKPPDSH